MVCFNGDGAVGLSHRHLSPARFGLGDGKEHVHAHAVSDDLADVVALEIYLDIFGRS